MPARLFLSTAAVALMLAAPVVAPGVASGQTMQDTPAATSSPMHSTARHLSTQDREFVKDAAIGGLFEVELGKIAEQNAQSQEVKQFGSRMVRDHSKVNDRLKSIAAKQGIELPQQLDRNHEQQRDRLSKLQGAAFDHAYMADMVKDHNADISAFRHEAQSGRDHALKEFATKTLHVLGRHDQLAKDIRRSLTATGSSRAPR
jgi:putative membrane protein